jgi:hypothetical protein
MKRRSARIHKIRGTRQTTVLVVPPGLEDSCREVFAVTAEKFLDGACMTWTSMYFLTTTIFLCKDVEQEFREGPVGFPRNSREHESNLLLNGKGCAPLFSL